MREIETAIPCSPLLLFTFFFFFSFFLSAYTSFFLSFSRATADTAIVRFSYRNLSVRPSVTRVNHSKMVQARITTSLLSTAWKTLVSGSVKILH